MIKEKGNKSTAGADASVEALTIRHEAIYLSLFIALLKALALDLYLCKSGK